MKKDEILAMVKRVSAVCPPRCQVEIVPTMQSDEVYLVIVLLPPMNITPTAQTLESFCSESKMLKLFFKENAFLRSVYFWEKQIVHSLHYEQILPLLGNAAKFRVVYCCDKKFVFYARGFECFDNSVSRFDYIGIKSGEIDGLMYVGRCEHSDLLIAHLIETINEI